MKSYDYRTSFLHIESFILEKYIESTQKWFLIYSQMYFFFASGILLLLGSRIFLLKLMFSLLLSKMIFNFPFGVKEIFLLV